MSSKALLGIALFVVANVLSFAVELLSSESSIQRWYSEHQTAVIVGSLGLFVLGLIATVADAVEEADRSGEPLASSSIVGAILSSAVMWGIVGGALGMAIEYFVWPLVQGGGSFLGKTATTLLQETGPLRVSCCVVGLLAGTRLRFADYKSSDSLTLAGSLAGGLVALATSSYFSADGPIAVSPAFALGPSTVAPAAVGASMAAITAVFKPGYEREMRQTGRARVEKATLERTKREEELAILEISSVRLRRYGYDLRTGEPKRFDFKHYILDLLLADRASGGFSPEDRVRIHKEAQGSTLEEVIGRLADRAASSADPQDRPRRRQEFINSIRSNPAFPVAFPIAKLMFDDFVGDQGPLTPGPPYIIIDTHGREVARFSSLKALEVYSKEVEQGVPPRRV